MPTFLKKLAIVVEASLELALRFGIEEVGGYCVCLPKTARGMNAILIGIRML